ncbi:partial Threonylcarbamoyl-AMP synthase, partial [Patescibacteria group bacterium]
PTEAVYGLGCEPMNEAAVLDLLRIKQRPIEKGLILIAASLEQIEPYLCLTDEILERVLPTWAGAVTWVIPAKNTVPRWLKGEHESLAVRVTAHPIAKALCEQYGGAIVSTSANISTQAAFKNAQEVATAFTELFVLEGALGELAQETAIYDALTGEKLR